MEPDTKQDRGFGGFIHSKGATFNEIVFLIHFDVHLIL